MDTLSRIGVSESLMQIHMLRISINGASSSKNRVATYAAVNSQNRRRTKSKWKLENEPLAKSPGGNGKNKS